MIAAKRLAAVLAVLLGVSAGPAGQRADSSRSGESGQKVLVRFKMGTSPSRIKKVHQSIGAKVEHTYALVDNLQVVSLPRKVELKEAVARYMRSGWVLYAEQDYLRKAFSTVPNDPRFGDLWGLHNTGQSGGTPDADTDAPEAWDLGRGSTDVVVAVIDTGVDYNHEDLAANVWRNESDCNSNQIDDDGNGYVDDCHGIDAVNDDTDPMDDNEHGTHVSGTIAGIGNNGIGVVGVNWNARVMALKFLSAGGSGSDSGAITCLEYAALMKDRGVNVVATSNSWGGGDYGQALYDAIRAIGDRGILFVAAAGNESQDNNVMPGYPADYYLANVISVAATDRMDDLSWFSNFGSHTVHVGAPGSEILSTIPNDGYATFSGTSMATPHVSGLAALLKAQDPTRNWKQLRSLIISGGDPVGSLDGKTVSGRRINVYSSMTCSGQRVSARLLPATDEISAASGEDVDLALMNIDCDRPGGEVSVTVEPGEGTVTLADDGKGSDQAAGDGVYSATWRPKDLIDYTLQFPGGDTVLVHVLRGYTAAEVPHVYLDIPNGKGIFDIKHKDEGVSSISSPFPILYGGGSFGRLSLTPNGIIMFGDTMMGYDNGGMPASTVNTLVAPFWDDLVFDQFGPSNVYWDAAGAQPNRMLVFEWRKARAWGCDSDPVKFQVVFRENETGFQFNYQDVGFGGDCTEHDGGGSATVGAQVGRRSGNQFSYNSLALRDNMSIRWTIEGSLALLTSELVDAVAGEEYSAQLEAVGGVPPYTWSIAGGSLTDGLQLDSLTGVISGTPTTPAISTFTVGVTDSLSPQPQSAQGELSLTVATGGGTLMITPQVLPPGVVGTPYSASVRATGGALPYSWSVAAGKLPDGLVLDPASGVASGTPSKSGTFAITAQVTDASFPQQQSDQEEFKLLVTEPGAPLVVVTTSLPDGLTGAAYQATLLAGGGQPPYSWSISSGSLPAGLSIDAGSGSISGVPAAAGSSSFTVEVTDSNTAVPQKAPAPLSITISDVSSGALQVSTATLPSGKLNVSYAFKLGAAGGSLPYRWSIVRGRLPRGLSMSKYGRISGVPTRRETRTFTVEATDASSPHQAARARLTLAVAR